MSREQDGENDAKNTLNVMIAYKEQFPVMTLIDLCRLYQAHLIQDQVKRSAVR